MHVADDPQFWTALEELVRTSETVIDRPRGLPHPNFPELIYPFDYGYLTGTSGGDGDALDVWLGSGDHGSVTAVACTVDPYKRDGELKVFLGCSETELLTISDWLRREAELPHLLIQRPRH